MALCMKNRRGREDEIVFKGKIYSATFDKLEIYLLNVIKTIIMNGLVII